MNAFIASLQFITSLPLGKTRPFDPKGIIVNFPLVGLSIGMALACFDLAVSRLWPPGVVAALDTVLLAVITGALHLDGLADTADGLYGRREPARILAIMKDSRVGAMGLVAVVCVLLTKTAAFGHIDQARFLALLIVPAYSRSAMMFAMRLLPYARAEDSTGRPFFGTPLTMPDFRFVLVPACFSLLLGWRGVLLNLFFAAVTAALIILYRKKLGGVTGDMLGAMTEVTEAVLLLAVSTGGSP